MGAQSRLTIRNRRTLLVRLQPGAILLFIIATFFAREQRRKPQ
jgi:hypothetical protein